LDGDGLFSPSLVAMRNYLRYARSEHTLVGAVNDPSSLGAVRAFEEAGRAQHCAVVGFDATLLGRTELRRPGSRLVGSITFFPEHYGAELIRLAIDVLDRKRVPPAVFGKYQLVTRENVNHLYPNDELLSNLALESMLLRSSRAAR
jgi:ribose transport system substrate-binding protein